MLRVQWPKNVRIDHVLIMHLLCACAVFTAHPHDMTWALWAVTVFLSQKFSLRMRRGAMCRFILWVVLVLALSHFMVLAKNILKFWLYITRRLVYIGLSVFLRGKAHQILSFPRNRILRAQLILYTIDMVSDINFILVPNLLVLLGFFVRLLLD